MDETIKWPKVPKFYLAARPLKDKVLNGTLIACDPSSGGTSQPGFAIFQAGELLTSGELELPRKKNVFERLQLLHAHVMKLTPDPPDVFAVEEIVKGAAHHYLLWSVGTIVSAARTPDVIQVPIVAWKALANVTPGYFKGNAMDAELIGITLIRACREKCDGGDT